MDNKYGKYITVAVLLMIGFLMGTCASADEGNGPPCDHPNFYVKGCDYPELNGEDGEDGQDGEQGPPGERGPRGPAGPQGPAGEVPTEWKELLDRRDVQYRNYLAASSVLDIDLPREYGGQRVTLTAASVFGTFGYGIGYSYMDNKGVALRLGFATSANERDGSKDHEVIWKGGISWEF